MRLGLLFSLAGLAAAPVVATEAAPHLKQMWEDFAPSAQLEIVSEERHATRIGVFNETIRSDPGYSFRYVTIRVTNNGSVDLGVHNWQFSAVDADGSERPATLANAHNDFDALRIRGHGGVMQGVVIFEMRDDAVLKKVRWEGDLAGAEGGWRTPDAEGNGHPASTG